MTLWTVACLVSLFMRYPRQEYRSGLSFPSPGDFPDSGIKPMSLAPPALQADYLPSNPLGMVFILRYLSIKGNT